MTTISHDPDALEFSAVVDGVRAHLDYTISGSVMTITHTRVPDEIGGRGVAAELTRAALEFARKEKLTVNPACSYAAAYLARHPQDAPSSHEDALLDEALDESFPASDPPAVGDTKN